MRSIKRPPSDGGWTGDNVSRSAMYLKASRADRRVDDIIDVDSVAKSFRPIRKYDGSGSRLFENFLSPLRRAGAIDNGGLENGVRHFRFGQPALHSALDRLVAATSAVAERSFIEVAARPAIIDGDGAELDKRADMGRLAGIDQRVEFRQQLVGRSGKIVSEIYDNRRARDRGNVSGNRDLG